MVFGVPGSDTEPKTEPHWVQVTVSKVLSGMCCGIELPRGVSAERSAVPVIYDTVPSKMQHDARQEDQLRL
jgi:hypothetical protein